MSTAAHFDPRPHRRPRIWKLIVIGLLLAAIAEPLVMYRSLVRQRELRYDARQHVEILAAP